MARHLLRLILLTSTLCSKSLFAAPYTDKELQGLSLYELEVLKENQIEKSQRKLIRALRKDKTKAIESCEALKEEYYDMPYNDFVKAAVNIESKSQRKLYSKISKNRKRYNEILKLTDPTFSVKVDEFSGKMEFETRLVKQAALSKGDCPRLKGAAAWVKTGSDVGLLRGAILDEKISYIQVYFQYISDDPDASDQYYGISQAIAKNLGERPVRKIDLDYEINTYSTRSWMNFTIGLSLHDLEQLYLGGGDEKFKIYSRGGNFVVSLRERTIKSFYDGLKQLKPFYS